jgi:hypothetical protein
MVDTLQTLFAMTEITLPISTKNIRAIRGFIIKLENVIKVFKDSQAKHLLEE